MFWKKQTAQPEAPSDTTITNNGPCRKQLRIHVKREDVETVRVMVLTDIKKRVTLPGFRKGKAPDHLVEQRYAQSIRDDTMRRAMQQAFEQVVHAHSLKIVGPFEVSRADFKPSDGIDLEAAVDVEPSFTLRSYKDIPVSSTQEIAVSAEEIQQALEKLRQSMAQLVPSQDAKSKEKKLPNLDDEMAKDLGYSSLEQLRLYVEAKLREQKSSEQKQAMENALCDELMRRHLFDVPPRLISRQTENLTREFRARLLLSGISDETVSLELSKFTDQLRQTAERYVRLGFILDRIAEKEEITVSSAELMEHLWTLARRWRKDPSETRKILDAQGLWPSVVSTIRREKTVEFLMKPATTVSG